MFEQAFKNIDDVLWKEAGCTTELDYTEQTSWLLFLKYLDEMEQEKAMEARLDGKKYGFIVDKDYRGESWAARKGKDLVDPKILEKPSRVSRSICIRIECRSASDLLDRKGYIVNQERSRRYGVRLLDLNEPSFVA